MISEFTTFVMRGMTEDDARSLMSGFCDVLVKHGLANEGISDDDEVRSVVILKQYDPNDDLSDEDLFAEILAGAIIAVLPTNQEVTGEGDS